MKLEEAWPLLSEHDRKVITDFERFLGVVDRDGSDHIPIGWVPYGFGWPAAPEGFDRIPVTAWTMPG